jgi:hypothetical protein
MQMVNRTKLIHGNASVLIELFPVRSNIAHITVPNLSPSIDSGANFLLSTYLFCEHFRRIPI